MSYHTSSDDGWYLKTISSATPITWGQAKTKWLQQWNWSSMLVSSYILFNWSTYTS